MNSYLRIKGKNFLKKILLLIIVIAIIYIVLKFLSIIIGGIRFKDKTIEEKRFEKNNTAIFGGEIKEEDAKIFVAKIDEFIEYCNQKKYQEAYNLLDDSCKNKFYPQLDDFKIYIDKVFDKLKRYSYQNLSNLNNNYVYELRLYDDIIAYGTNEIPKQKLYYVVLKKYDNDTKISVNGFIDTNFLNIQYKIGELIFKIKKEDIYYEHIEIELEIENNSNEYVIWKNADVKYLMEGSKNVEYNNSKYTRNYMYVTPNIPVTLNVSFDKSFDTTGYDVHKFIIKNLYFTNYDIFNEIINDEIEYEKIEEYVKNKIKLELEI